MSFAVPEPVAAHLAAEAAKNANAISRCFAQDGAVGDVTIAGAMRSGNGKRRQTQNTNTSWRWLAFERSESGDRTCPTHP
jgi:hypothetical protein